MTTARSVAAGGEGAGTSAPLRERQRVAVRDELRTVAIDAFLRLGYEETNIADIARAAGVSDRTFYRYFPTKELVALDWIDDTASTVHEALRQQPADALPGQALCEALIAAGPSPEMTTPHKRIMPLIFTTPRLLNAYYEHSRSWAAAVADVLAERMGADPSDARPRLWSTIAFAIANDVAQSPAVLAEDVDFPSALRRAFAQASEFFGGAVGSS